MSEQILELLQSEDRFLLSGHTNPDGDCLGAEVALYHLLVQMGKECRVMNPDPYPPSYGFFTQHTPIGDYRTEAKLAEFSVLVLLDCAQLSRLGEMAQALPPLLNEGRRIAVIDHHIGSESGDGEVSYVDSTAPATGAMVHSLYGMLKQPISKPAAEGIFVSLVSDTGWFRYSNTTAEALRMAAELVEVGVEPDRIYDQLNRQHHPDSVGLLSRSLATARYGLDGRYAYAVLDRALMDRASKIGFDTDQVLEPLRSVRGVEVVALLKELYQGGLKLSLRAAGSGQVDVQAIAKSFGGGGHRKAAGATLAMPLPQAVQTLEEQVLRALQGLEAE